MVDIVHRIGATASQEDVYAALTTIDGLAGWWTEDTTGDQRGRRSHPVPLRRRSGARRLRHAGAGGARRPSACAGRSWQGPEEWVGTHVGFELSQEDGYTIVMFEHSGWREVVPFMYHCSTKWATFLMSLKELVEDGKGQPAPNDVQVSNWH